MSFWAYLRSAWPTFVLAGAAAALCAIVLLVSGTNGAVTLLVACLFLLAALAAHCVDFLRKRAFYGDLARCVEDVEHPLWITEMVCEPDDVEGRLAYDALKAVSKAANDDVARYRRQTQEYREYIETWVHEAKSPLAAAHLMLENLMEAVPADETGERLLGKTEALGEELDRVEGYIEQALFFARSESLERDYLIRSYNLRDLVGNAVRANARVLLGAHVAPFRVNLEREVFTDEKWMTFILGQLIQNSAKYARSEGAELVFTGRLMDEGMASERIELEVRDNGCGVAEADLPRVFDRGFTGQNGRTGKRATGIGLYLVGRLCDKMGLGVRADSRAGEFFAVTISFPTNRMHYFE
ncbi:MAG: sensor histidine kinase [Coriobacteriaceae bacterium]|nr:sensor histidine kinase [Coriobacteriaceae bacterium]